MLSLVLRELGNPHAQLHGAAEGAEMYFQQEFFAEGKNAEMLGRLSAMSQPAASTRDFC